MGLAHLCGLLPWCPGPRNSMDKVLRCLLGLFLYQKIRQETLTGGRMGCGSGSSGRPQSQETLSSTAAQGIQGSRAVATAVPQEGVFRQGPQADL